MLELHSLSEIRPCRQPSLVYYRAYVWLTALLGVLTRTVSHTFLSAYANPGSRLSERTSQKKVSLAQGAT